MAKQMSKKLVTKTLIHQAICAICGALGKPTTDKSAAKKVATKHMQENEGHITIIETKQGS